MNLKKIFGIKSILIIFFNTKVININDNKVIKKLGRKAPKPIDNGRK